MGAVPLCRTKCPEVGNRRMSPTRPTMIAAINGRIPYTSVTVVFDASMAATWRWRTSWRAAWRTRTSISRHSRACSRQIERVRWAVI